MSAVAVAKGTAGEGATVTKKDVADVERDLSVTNAVGGGIAERKAGSAQGLRKYMKGSGGIKGSGNGSGSRSSGWRGRRNRYKGTCWYQTGEETAGWRDETAARVGAGAEGDGRGPSQESARTEKFTEEGIPSSILIHSPCRRKS